VPVALERAVRLEFAAGRTPADVPDEIRHYRDLGTLYGRPLGLGRLLGAHGNSFTDMAEELLGPLGLRERGVDLIVLALHGFDCGVQKGIGCRLTELVPGRPLVFAVAEQGAAAPYTALKLAAALRRAGEARTAAVIAMEQSTAPEVAGVELPDRDRAVGVLLDETGPLTVESVQVRPAALDPLPDSALEWWDLPEVLAAGRDAQLRRYDANLRYQCSLKLTGD
jgi:hypothetical protein